MAAMEATAVEATEPKRKYLKRQPRWSLGICVAGIAGIATWMLSHSIGIGLFAGVAFGSLAAFALIGTSKNPDGPAFDEDNSDLGG
jgi:hypothetical protein